MSVFILTTCVRSSRTIKVRFITGGSILTEKWSTSVPAIDSSISKKLVNSSLNDGYDVSILKDMIETDTLRVESDAFSGY